MEIIKRKLVPFLLGVITTFCTLFLYADTRSESKPQTIPPTISNRIFVGSIPIVSGLGKEAKCIDLIEFTAPAFVLGTTDKKGWLLVSYMGRHSGWIPVSTVTIDKKSQESLQVVATEPAESYTPPNNEQYIKSIRDITKNQGVQPFFVCFAHIPNAPNHQAAVYVDKNGGTYYVSSDTFRVANFVNGYNQIENAEKVSKPIGYEFLEEFAKNYLSENSLDFEKYYNELQINFHGKGGGYFPYAYIYTGYLYKPIDGLNHAEIQITFLPNGTIIGYSNTLDLIDVK